jgi:hypothetical protein
VSFVMPGAAVAVGWTYPDVPVRILGLGAISKAGFDKGVRRVPAPRQVNFQCIGQVYRITPSDGTSAVRARVRISDFTLEIVCDDDGTDAQLEMMDALNPYAGTSLSEARVLSAFGEAQAGFGLDYGE